ncbi:hypothetical protein [Lacrimispora sp.]
MKNIISFVALKDLQTELCSVKGHKRGIMVFSVEKKYNIEEPVK